MAKPAGRRRWRVNLLRPQPTTDALNTPVDGWVAAGARSAARQDISSGERMRAQQLGAVIDTRFTVLRDSLTAQVDPTWRIEDLDRGRVYEITAIRELAASIPIELELDGVALATADGQADFEA